MTKFSLRSTTSARPRGSRRLNPAIAVATLTLGALVGCSTQPEISVDPHAASYRTIHISRGISDETAQVAEIYAQALRKAGYTVELVDTGSDRSGYLEKMRSTTQHIDGMPTASPNPSASPENSVDLAADYSGNLLLYLTQDGSFSPAYIQRQREAMASASASPSYNFGWGDNDQAAAREGSTPNATAAPTPEPSLAPGAAGQDPSPFVSGGPGSSVTPSPVPTELNIKALTTDEIDASIKRVLPESLSLLDASDAQNRDGLVVSAATAQKYNLSSIEDLAAHCSQLTFGGPEGFKTRSYGLKSLKEKYGCTPKKFVVENDQSKLSDKLADNTVQVADIFSASAEIDDNGYVSLADTQNIFIPQNIVPVYNEQSLPESARNAINSVSAQLSTDDLKTFNRLTSGQDAIDKHSVADCWMRRTTE